MIRINDIVGKWDFVFWIEEDQKTILEISTNGKASTGATFYKTEIVEGKIHMYIEDYVDYWGTYNNGILEGEASSIYNDWHWRATRHIDPIIKPISQNRLFDSNWVIINDTDELCDNHLKFSPNGKITSALYGEGSWEYQGNDLVIKTANGFITYNIKEVDGVIVASATNKIGEEWKIVPHIQLIPKPIPKPKPSIFKDERSKIQQLLSDNRVCYLYHFTARENITKIKDAGGLYSWHFLESHGMVIPKPGGDDMSRSLDKKYHLEDYVRLSFCERHPMSFVKKKEGYDIVYLKVAIDPAFFKDTLYSDMNATDNLHHHGGTLNDLKKVHFDATRIDYPEGMDKKYKQAEVMVKTFVPIRYIININNF